MKLSLLFLSNIYRDAVMAIYISVELSQRS